MKINKQLRNARISAGLTQQALAERLRVSKSYISNIEQGVGISEEQADFWAAACGYELISILYLRPKMIMPTQEGKYLIRFIGESEFVEAFWIKSIGAFVLEDKETYDIEDEIISTHIEEWKIIKKYSS